jgi:hypothetical protein
MTRLLTSMGLAVLLVLAGCATTTPSSIPDTGTSDSVSDMSDIPGDTSMPDTVVTDTGVPDTSVPDTTPADITTDGPSGGVVGDACYSASQCGGVPGAGVTCLTSIMGYITFPGGYCSAVCTSDMDCGTGGACVNLADLGRYCLKRCTSAGDCRTSEGYACDVVTGTPGTFCIPPFTSPESSGG